MTPDGLVTLPSDAPYSATADRLDAVLHENGIVPMLRWDHARAAADVGLALRPLLLVVFGNPQVGTCLMRASPTVGIDLPLKLLLWEDDAGKAWVGYNAPAWIRARHGLGRNPEESRTMASLLHGIAARVAGRPAA